MPPRASPVALTACKCCCMGAGGGAPGYTGWGGVHRHDRSVQWWGMPWDETSPPPASSLPLVHWCPHIPPSTRLLLSLSWCSLLPCLSLSLASCSWLPCFPLSLVPTFPRLSSVPVPRTMHTLLMLPRPSALPWVPCTPLALRCSLLPPHTLVLLTAGRGAPPLHHLDPLVAPHLPLAPALLYVPC